MARITYTYQTYSDPEATERSKSHAKTLAGFSALLFLGGLFAILTYLYYSFQLFISFKWEDYLISLAGITVAAVVFYFVSASSISIDGTCKQIVLTNLERWHHEKQEKADLHQLMEALQASQRKRVRDFARRYFIWVCVTILGVPGLIGFLNGISMVVNQADWKSLLQLIGCLVWTLGSVSFLVIGLARMRGEQASLIQIIRNQYRRMFDIESSNDSAPKCGKCGTRIYSDSIYCEKCGCELLEDPVAAESQHMI